MRPLLVRVLKNGLMTAAALAVVGYLFGAAAEFMLAGQPAFARGDGPGEVAEIGSSLRTRLPVRLAAIGLGLVVAFECLSEIVRGRRLPAPAPAKSGQTDRLYDELLRHSADVPAADPANRSSRSGGPST